MAIWRHLSQGRARVLVRLHASGVNPSDVKLRAGARVGAVMAYPRVIPHSDGAGVIEAVGAGVDAARVGERVWVWNAGWQRAFGTAAEYVALPAEQAVRLPDAVSFAEGACFGHPRDDGLVRGDGRRPLGGPDGAGHGRRGHGGALRGADGARGRGRG